MFYWLSVGAYRNEHAAAHDADARNTANRERGVGPPVGSSVLAIAYSSDQFVLFNRRAQM